MLISSFNNEFLSRKSHIEHIAREIYLQLFNRDDYAVVIADLKRQVYSKGEDIEDLIEAFSNLPYNNVLKILKEFDISPAHMSFTPFLYECDYKKFKKRILKNIRKSTMIANENKTAVINELKAAKTIQEMLNVCNTQLNTNYQCFNEINEYLEYVFDDA